MSVINTNITSLIAQQNLNKSQSALTTAMQRLSSGSRINSAKDDAAGQAIANRMTASITGLAQAQRNANDGISVAQTAEGALNQINDNLQRIRELTVQSQNGTNSPNDLTSIQNEIGQRLDEINRISDQTDFNGVKVLSKDQKLTIQVGASDGQTIDINLSQINAKTLGLNGFNVDGTGTKNDGASVQNLLANGFTADPTTNGKYNSTATFNAASTVDDVFANLKTGSTIKLADGSASYTYDASSKTFTYDQKDATLASLGADLGLTPSAGQTNTVVVKLGTAETRVNISSTGALTNADTGENLYLTGSAGSMDLSATNTGGSQATITDLATELGARTGAANAGSITTADGTTYKQSTTAAADTVDVTGGKIDAQTLATTMKGNIGSAQYNVDLDGSASTSADEYNVTYASSVTSVKTGNATGAGSAVYTSGFGDNSLVATPNTSVYLNSNGKITDGAANQVYVTSTGSLSLDSVSGATATKDPLAALDSALKQVDSLRSDLGAIQNRFDSAITNLQTNQTNLSAARSRIQDADYSVEVANMTKAQILQQAGTSVLAQANKIPQSVLSLLQ